MTTLAWPSSFSQSAAIPRGRWRLVLLLVVTLACALCGRLVFLAWPFDSDGSMFIYLGKSVCDGDRFCHDVIDNKFPTVGLMTSVFWRLFGTNWTAYVFTQTLMALGASALLSRTAARHFGRNAGLPTLAAALIYLNFTPSVFGGFQLETLQLFFTTLGACAAIEAIVGGDGRDALLAGLAAGCAMLLKPTGLSPLAALIGLFIVQRRWRLTALAAAGLVPPLAVGFCYIWRTGIVDDLSALVRQIGAYASQTPLRWEDAFKPFTVLMLVGIGPLIRGWTFRRQTQGTWPRTDLSLFVMAWFVLELLGALAQRRMYAYHFLPVAPPAALLFGLIPRRPDSLKILAALLPVAAASMIGAVSLLHAAPDQSNDLHNYVLANTRPADAIWMDNYPRLLLETNRRPGGRIPLTFLFGNTDNSAAADAAMLTNDFSIRRPTLIILPTNIKQRIQRDQQQTLHLLRSPIRSANYAAAWRAIADYVHRNYHPAASIDDQTVWRKNEAF